MAFLRCLMLLVLAVFCETQARNAVCVLRPGTNPFVTGVIQFSQQNEGDSLTIDVNIKNLDPVPEGSPASDFQHGFHVHTYGDLTNGCGSTGGHYNPTNVHHGGPSDIIRHAGDFGNLDQTPDGRIVTQFTDDVATLFGDFSIIGRAIVLHAGQDDLGRGGNPASLANGNAGPRLACCVIGWAA